VNIAADAPKRPALRYYGGKWRLAQWIISHFPEHQHYVEPCGGAASVLLQKPRSPLETYNDLDGNVVNFFRMLRSQPSRLIQSILLTPWARAEYELAKLPEGDSIERARRFYCLSVMGIAASNRTSSGMRMVMEVNGGIPAVYNAAGITHLLTIADRLLGVQFESGDARDLIPKYDRQGTLFYVDPPYPVETRTHQDEYTEEVDELFHRDCASLLHQCLGYVVVSGYACPLYTELYEAHGWKRYDKEAQVNSGGKRIESLWLSPRTVEALNKPEQARLFSSVEMA
jgi:DNA adenine methylase